MSKNITVAFDDLDPMSVYKNMVYGFKLRSCSKEGIDRRVREVAEIPWIPDLSDCKPKQFSGGKQ